MSKSQIKKNSPGTSRSKSSTGIKKEVNPIDANPFLDKYFWLVIPLLAVIYYLSSRYSMGFYQDDEIGHYVNMKEFWNDPFVILGNWPKPGYKLFMVIPALFGYQAVIFFNSLIAAVTVYLTYILIKEYKVGYAFFGALMLAFQPLFFDLSFRSYAEIFTGMLFVAMAILYKRELFFLCGLVCGYIFTVRQEIVLVAMVLAVIFFMKKNYAAIAAIAIFPLLFDFFGYLKSGDMLFVINEMTSLGAMDFGGANRGFFHYFKVYIFIIGPVSLALFLLGFFGFAADMNKYKEYLKRYDMLYIIFVFGFMVQALLMVKGTNPGTWRYLLQISPIAAFFATVGLNNLAVPSFRKINYYITGILLFLVLVFMSKTSNGLDLTEQSDFGKLIVVALFLLLTIALYSADRNQYMNKLSIILLILSIGYFFMSFEPRKLSAENLTVKDISEFLKNQSLGSKKIYVTSQTQGPVVLFGDVSNENRKHFIHLNSQNLSGASKGDLIIWDSHYSYRPEYKNDVKLENLKADSSYKVIKEFTSGDNRYKAFIFEKTN